LQEIGPRFTLKLRWLKKNIPAVQNFGDDAKALTFDTDDGCSEEQTHALMIDDQEQYNESSPDELKIPSSKEPPKVVPPKHDEYLWQWKVRIRAPNLVDFHADVALR